MTDHGRKYGDKDSHPIPLWNGVFEHYDRIGAALWEFAWCIDRITEECDGVGIVLGGSPVKVRAIVDAIKGSKKKETVRRHLDTLEKEDYIRRRRTPYGHVIEVLNSRKFGIWKQPKEKPQNDVSLPQQKPIYGLEKPTGGSEKPKNSINKEDSAVTQQEDAAVKPACPVWKETGVDPRRLPGPFRQLCEDLWPTRNGSIFDFMGLCLDAWHALGNSRYPPAWVRSKAELARLSAKQEPERPELEAIPWEEIILPHDDHMERAVLGAILDGHPQSAELLGTIKPDDFFNSWHRKIAKCVLTLHEAGNVPDVLAIHDELTRNGGVEAAGGIPYVASLMGEIPFKSDVLYVHRGLRRMAAFRQTVHIAENVKELALAQAGSVESLLDSAVEKFSRLARDLESTEDDGTPYLDSAMQALAVAREGARLKIYTDVDKLDQWTGGFREGELVVLTAETGTGKSLFAAQIRARACRDGYLALFCSGEMTRTHLASRELATESGVMPLKMRRDDLLTTEDFEALVTAASHQCRKCRILDGELSLPRIRRAARKMKCRDGLDLLILDYDELIEAEGKTEFEQQRVIARAAKSFAIELKCAVILISQLRKTTQGEDAGKPTLQRLYGNAAKQKFASFIILADRPYVRELQGDEKEAELQLLKSRDGKTGRIKATFNIKTLRFEQEREAPSDALWRSPAESRERED